MSRLSARKLFIILGLIFIIIGILAGIAITIGSVICLAGKIGLANYIKIAITVGIFGAVFAGIGIILIFISVE